MYMESGRPPHGAVGPHIYEAPPTDHGRADNPGRFRLPRSFLFGNEDPTADIPVSPDMSSDSKNIFEGPDGIEDFMADLSEFDRHTDHINRLLGLHEHYSIRDASDAEDQTATEIERMAIVLHDFIDKAILHPEDTVNKGDDKLGRTADELKHDAMHKLSDSFNKVGDQDGLVIALAFAIDGSKWESSARVWRSGATAKIQEMVDAQEIDERTATILRAAINKTAMPEDVDEDEVIAVLTSEQSLLRDLKLGRISKATLDNNVEGLFLKGLETLDNIGNPPPDNPASTYRDCIEAMNFFVPALMAHGYKDLAADLRSAALQWFYDDPNGDAKHQHDVSKRHYGHLQDTLLNLQQDQQFADIAVETESRVKTDGSIREKLHKDKYKNIHLTPDGVGFAFVVPDDMPHEEIQQFALAYQQRLISGGYRIKAKHPHPGEPVFEEREGDNSDYKAFHMNFYYYPEDSDEEVPFEIQVLTKTQNEEKLYGEYSDLFYKAGTKYMPEDKPFLEHLAQRGKAGREMMHALTIQSIAEVMAVAPDIPFIFNKLFRHVNVGDDREMLVPPGLEGLATEVLDMPDLAPGEEADLTILPPSRVSKSQFVEALGIFGGRKLQSDPKILQVLELVGAAEAGNRRADGEFVFEGHILPTALFALMLVTQSGKIWDSKEAGPLEYMSDVVTIAMLHDYVENSLDAMKIKDPVAIREQRAIMLDAVESQFSTTVRDAVDALTLQKEIGSRKERRKQYSEKIRANDYARFIKPADRWQNHITDLVVLANAEARGEPLDPNGELYHRFMEYFAKTDYYQSEDFVSDALPNLYPRIHNIIWQFAKHFGYNFDDYKVD